MNSTVTELEDNKVKLAVTVDPAEFEKDLDAAFKRIASEVRLPGFRPGKAPRKLLEARLGAGVARDEALREALPSYYAEAIREHDVDVIAPPDIDITAGQDDGPIEFEAIVEVRPRINVAGYKSLRVEIPSPEVSDEEIDEYIDRLRDQNADLETVERAAATDDHVTIDINGVHDGEPVPGLTAADYDYRVGLGAVVPELDENLEGASAGDTVEFKAAHPDPDEEGELEFTIEVKEVKAKVLPDLTDEFVAETSEFKTIDEMKADLTTRMSASKRMQAQMALHDATAKALADLVEEEAPEPLVAGEMQSRVQDMAMRLQAQGMQLEQYMQMSGTSPEEFTEELKELATEAVKVDLALRHIVEVENTEVSEEDITTELEGLATQVGDSLEVVRERLEEADQMKAVALDLQKRNALTWLVEQVEIVDPDGNAISRDSLEIADEPDDEDAAAVAESEPDTPEEGDSE